MCCVIRCCPSRAMGPADEEVPSSCCHLLEFRKCTIEVLIARYERRRSSDRKVLSFIVIGAPRELWDLRSTQIAVLSNLFADSILVEHILCLRLL